MVQTGWNYKETEVNEEGLTKEQREVIKEVTDKLNENFISILSKPSITKDGRLIAETFFITRKPSDKGAT